MQFILLMLDESTNVEEEDDVTLVPSSTQLPTQQQLQQAVTELAREIERSTQGSAISPNGTLCKSTN